MRVNIESRQDLRDWLERTHEQRESVMLVHYKKCVPEKFVHPNDILDEALCYGWIDGAPKKLDDERSMTRLSPRRAKSAWSAVNKKRVQALIKQGLMHPSGQAAIDQAKQNGMWTWMDDIDALVIPVDLSEALRSDTKADAYFAAMAPSMKRFVLRWIKQAKRAETRAKRIAETVDAARVESSPLG